MTGKGDREYSQPGIAAPAPSGGSDIPAAVPMDSFSLRRAGGGREGPGVRISADTPGIRGVSFGISGWAGHSWDAGVEFRDPGRIPGVRNVFPAAFPVFSLPLFPVFFSLVLPWSGWSWSRCHEILGIHLFIPKFLACDLQGKSNLWEEGGGGGCGASPGSGNRFPLDHSRCFGRMKGLKAAPFPHGIAPGG